MSGMQVHQDLPPSILTDFFQQFANSHLYSAVEESTVRVDWVFWTKQMLWLGHKLRLLNPQASMLTIHAEESKATFDGKRQVDLKDLT